MLVRTLADFRRHVTLHRKRVRVLAVLADPGIVDRWQGRALLALHDVAKYPLLAALWRFYGGKGDRVEARRLYDRLNRLDALLAAPVRWLTPADFAERVAAAERIADCVDRHRDPVAREEFAQPISPPLSDYLDGLRFYTGVRLSAHYAAIVTRFGLAYEPRSARSS